ncbi:unnamed protein product [Dibothriocephalus latus]|uniref:Uncharacterized protein n=1 Tax=Dibothriocephalus latus TaxID=60516 RepID=A0A3P7R9W0_DIBLA|nr:unnamed protein product [Dibothriocephalus latus]
MFTNLSGVCWYGFGYLCCSGPGARTVWFDVLATFAAVVPPWRESFGTVLATFAAVLLELELCGVTAWSSDMSEDASCNP